MYKPSSSMCKAAHSFGVNSTTGRLPTYSWSRTTSREISLEHCDCNFSGEEQVQLAEATEDSAAYQAYLKGRFLLNRRRQVDIENAVIFFEEAKASDPDFALAHVGLGDSYIVIGAQLVRRGSGQPSSCCHGQSANRSKGSSETRPGSCRSLCDAGLYRVPAGLGLGSGRNGFSESHRAQAQLRHRAPSGTPSFWA